MKVSIVGKGTGWDAAPSYGEVWCVNDLCLRRYASKIFHMHKPDRSPLFWDVVAHSSNNGIPLVTLEKIDGVNTSEAFPIADAPFRYFTNSISYMLAYALIKGAESVDIYGVTVAAFDEYALQRPNIEFWVGYLIGKGVDVKFKTFTFLCDSPFLYGYEDTKFTLPDMMIRQHVMINKANSKNLQ